MRSLKREDYINSSTTVRLREKKLLRAEDYNRLADARDFAEAVRILRDTKYGESFDGIERIEDYETALSRELVKTYGELYDIVPDKELVELMGLKYDAHNLKVKLKDHFLQTQSEDLLIPIGRIDESRQGYRSLNDMYQDILAEHYTELSEAKDPQLIELLVDKLYFKEMIMLADILGYEELQDYVSDSIDYANLMAMFRMKKQHKDVAEAKKFFLDGGSISITELVNSYYQDVEQIIDRFSARSIGSSLRKAYDSYRETDRLSDFEKALDNYQLELLGDTKFITYGPEVIFAYLNAIEREVQNVRIILVSKLNHLSSDFISERLRETNV